MRRTILGMAAAVLAGMSGAVVVVDGANQPTRRRPEPYTPQPKSEHASTGHSAKMRAKLERRAKRLYRP